MPTRRDLLGLLLATAAGRLAAQPVLSQRIGATIETEGSAHYAFEHFRLGSADGERRYRIVVATPRRPPPAGGYPALYLLDGNAALMAVDEALLDSAIQQDVPPVLAFVCYDNDLRIDATARAYDYTPVRGQDGGEEWDVAGKRRSGGADIFLDLLTGDIRTGVLGRAPVNARRQAIWGHSYGGLFALHALFTHPDAFAAYIAADPSLWWGEGLALKRARQFIATHDAISPASLSLIVGTGTDSRSRAGRGSDDDTARRDVRRAAPSDAARQLAADLATVQGLAVRHEELAGLSHGQTLPASLPRALQIAAQIAIG